MSRRCPPPCAETQGSGGAVVAVMKAAATLGAREARALCYADSGDVSGDKTAVVGYLAAALGRFEPQARRSQESEGRSQKPC